MDGWKRGKKKSLLLWAKFFDMQIVWRGVFLIKSTQMPTPATFKTGIYVYKSTIFVIFYKK